MSPRAGNGKAISEAFKVAIISGDDFAADDSTQFWVRRLPIKGAT
jgi:hypothetical protein